MNANGPLTSKPVRRHNLRDKKGSFARAGGAEDAKLTPILCRVCGCDLLTNAERLIGVHIGCVSDRVYRRKSLKVPTYGFGKPNR